MSRARGQRRGSSGVDLPFYAENKSPVVRAAAITAERALRLVEAGSVRADSCMGAGSLRLDAFLERLPAPKLTLPVAKATLGGGKSDGLDNDSKNSSHVDDTGVSETGELRGNYDAGRS